MESIVKPRCVVLPNLALFNPSQDGKGKPRIAIEADSKEDLSYHINPIEQGEFCQDNFHHFTVILNHDNSIWVHGTLYLLSKLENYRSPSYKTLNSIASDLIDFQISLNEKDINYLESPKRKLRRPTYAYRTTLVERIGQGDIAPSTASRRMSSVIGFYRWLQNQHDANFEYPLWTDKEVLINFKDHKGFSMSKSVVSTDLKFNVPQNSDDYSDCIEDEGKLRPLPKDEQEALILALNEIENPEMKLAFLISLTTGARIQTVFTLKRKHIQVKLPHDLDALPVFVGMGTGVDTKYQKRMTIFIPKWLAERLHTYSISERAQRRKERSRHRYEKDDEQYLFLTQTGSPYFISESDPLITSYKRPPQGDSVRQFISAQLFPVLRRHGHNFDFKFHDLRATYGLNLLEEKLLLVENGRDKLFDVLMFVKERMGHSSITSTERYINYKKKKNIALNVQSEFEMHIRNLTAGESE